jgi:hypothetical protein
MMKGKMDRRKLETIYEDNERKTPKELQRFLVLPISSQT